MQQYTTLRLPNLSTAEARALRRVADQIEGDDAGAVYARRILTTVADQVDPPQLSLFGEQPVDYSVRPPGTLF